MKTSRAANYVRLAITALLCVALFSALAAAPASASATKPADDEPLSERQASLLLQLANAEANIKAINAALRRTGYKVGQAYDRIDGGEKGNEIMDRKGGGPVGWKDFYGKTAREYNRNGGSFDRRPRQFDFIYRANTQMTARAREEAAALGHDQAELLARRQKHEADQARLWATLAWEQVKDREIAFVPLYRLKLKPADARSELLRAPVLLLRTADLASAEGLEAVAADQGEAFAVLSGRLKAAYATLQESMASSLFAAALAPEERREGEQIKALCKELEGQCAAIADYHRQALDSDRAKEDRSKLEFRAHLQSSLMKFSDTMRELDERLRRTALAWGISGEPGVESPDNGALRSAMAGKPESAPGVPAAQRAEGENTKARKVDVLREIDVAKDAVAGNWAVKGGSLVGDPRGINHIELPYAPPAEYDYRVTFVRTTGAGGISLVCVGGGHQFAWNVGAGNNTICGFGLVDGHPARSNVTTRTEKQWITNGKVYVVTVKVRKDHVEAWLDDTRTTTFETNYGNVSLNPNNPQRHNDTLGLLAGYGSVTIRSAEVIEITGEGKRLR